jgi:hypothetical protein
MYLGLPNLGLTYVTRIPSSSSTDYITPGTFTVSVPSGKTGVVIEGYGGGAGGDAGLGDYGGGGGAYSKKTVTDLSGITALFLNVPDIGFPDSSIAGGDCFVKANTSGGTILMLAKGGGTDGTFWHGGASASGVGDVVFSGGNGSQGNGVLEVGGGAAGPLGNGGDSVYPTPGTGKGGLAGNGGDYLLGGSNYGGGGGARVGESGTEGAQGAIRLTWT